MACEAAIGHVAATIGHTAIRRVYQRITALVLLIDKDLLLSIRIAARDESAFESSRLSYETHDVTVGFENNFPPPSLTSAEATSPVSRSVNCGSCG